MLDTSMPCFICGEGTDPREPQIVLIPKAWAHIRHQAEGIDCMEAAKSLPCCDAATLLQTFGGCLLQKYDGPAADELWWADNLNKKLVRYRIDKGRLMRLVDPKEIFETAPPAASVQGHEATTTTDRAVHEVVESSVPSVHPVGE